MTFPFNQPINTKDCGYRCTYYVLDLKESYEEWLNNFKFFSPIKEGINFNDVCNILSFYKKYYKFTQLTEKGLYIVYSGVWLKPEGRNHGHYFVYQDGTIYCSTRKHQYHLDLKEVIKRLEAKTTEGAFRCLQVF